MYKEARIDISIDSVKYEQILNNICFKAPVEIGVEIAVYMILFGLLEDTNMVVVDVNTMWRSKAGVYSNASDKNALGAVPDLVIVNKSFDFRGSNDNRAYGFIEVKSLACTDAKEDNEMKSHKNNTNNLLWTNGVIWKYYSALASEKNWHIDLRSEKMKDNSIHIDSLKYGELLYKLKQIEWENIGR